MITTKDILRPISGFVAVQPVILIYLFLFHENPMDDYISVGWGLNFVMTVFFIFYYSWYESLSIWKDAS
jgi:hypothetical protein